MSSLSRRERHRTLPVDDDAYPKLFRIGDGAQVFYPYSDVMWFLEAVCNEWVEG